MKLIRTLPFITLIASFLLTGCTRITTDSSEISNVDTTDSNINEIVTDENASANDVGEEADMSDWQTYTNEEHGFWFTYNSNWILEEHDDKVVLYLSKYPDQKMHFETAQDTWEGLRTLGEEKGALLSYASLHAIFESDNYSVYNKIGNVPFYAAAYFTPQEQLERFYTTQLSNSKWLFVHFPEPIHQMGAGKILRSIRLFDTTGWEKFYDTNSGISFLYPSTLQSVSASELGGDKIFRGVNKQLPQYSTELTVEKNPQYSLDYYKNTRDLELYNVEWADAFHTAEIGGSISVASFNIIEYNGDNYVINLTYHIGSSEYCNEAEASGCEEYFSFEPEVGYDLNIVRGVLSTFNVDFKWVYIISQVLYLINKLYPSHTVFTSNAWPTYPLYTTIFLC